MKIKFNTALCGILFLIFLIPQESFADGICLPTTIRTKTNETNISNCTDDGVADKVQFFPSTWATAYRWLVTDTNDVIVTFFWGSVYNFENLDEGTYRVWGISYSGSIDIPIGVNINDADFDVNCHIISDNFISINNFVPDAGALAFDDGSDTKYVCAGDGQANLVVFNNQNNHPGAYSYIITDENGQILATTDDNSFDFENAPLGTCLIYGINYTDDLTVVVGQNIADGDLSSGCFAITDDALTVIRTIPAGDTVNLASGDDMIGICVNDGNADRLDFINTSSSNAPYAYVITDANNTVLGFTTTTNFNFENAPEGICRVWGVSYTGNLTIMNGVDAVAVALSDDCWELSNNFITVNRYLPNGAEVSLLNGETSILICPDNNQTSTISYQNNSSSIANYTYIITDENDNILSIQAATANDFSGAPVGICRIYGLSYWENLSIGVGDNLLNADLADQCFNLSNNYIEVIRESPVAGEVALVDGGLETFTCFGDGVADEVTFVNNSPSNAEYVYFLTDTSNQIVGISLGTQDFENTSTGICRVWGVSYTGALSFSFGANLQNSDLSDDCFDISENYVEVIRDTPNAGTVSFADNTEITITCTQDGTDDILAFFNANASPTNYAYAITDDNNNLLGISTDGTFNFEGAPIGFCFVYGVAYTGNIAIQVGDNIDVVDFSDECYDYSDNQLTVIRTIPEGGNLSIIGSSSLDTIFCSGDNAADVLALDVSASSFADYVFVVTDENDNILAFNDTGVLDFEGVDEGTCRIWGLSFTGSLQVGPGDNLIQLGLSDECYNISNNFITVTRVFVEGGAVTYNGESSIYVCPDDLVSNTIIFENSSSADNADYAYVLTDQDNVVIEIPTDDEFDFEGFDSGVVHVWGISFLNNLTINIGDSITTAAISDACFSLSDTFLAVIIDAPDGGQIDADDSNNLNLCVNDGIADPILFQNSSTSLAQYAYILTDENNIIEAIFNDPLIDFETTNAGAGRIWGLSYTGNILVFPGDNAAMALLTDDCFELSSNFIVLNREAVDGASIFVPSGAETIYACPGDGNPDFVGLFNTSNLNTADYRYIITDDQNMVLDIVAFNQVDFEDVPEGVCRIWGLSHTGNLTVEPGDNLFEVVLSDACYGVSENFIEIIRVNPDAGTVSTTDGAIIVDIEIDGLSDSIFFANTASVLAKFRYVITDENDVIEAILETNVYDFENAPVGRRQIYGLAFTGSLQAQIGEIFNETAPTTGCFDISDNVIEVNIIQANNNDSNTVFDFQSQIGSANNVQVNIYPNPATNWLAIKLSTVSTSQSIQIFSRTGQLVFRKEIGEAQVGETINIQLDTWQNGLYYLIAGERKIPFLVQH